MKKLQNDEGGTFLISLNPKYQPIPVHLDRDSFHIFGKVCRATR
ncbi:MAG: S24 family peptidase [Eubacterium sp.]